jgi:hypothetical protein
MADAIVTGRAIGWLDDDGVARSARRGEKVSMPEREFKRNAELGLVAKPSSKEAKAAIERGAPGTTSLPSVQAGAPGHPHDDDTPEDDTTGGGEPKWPRTHDELDALATELKVDYPEGTTTVAEKTAALEAAGHKPPAASE